MNAAAARFGAPLVVSLALHAVVLGAITDGEPGSSGKMAGEAQLNVHLASSPGAAPIAQPVRN